MMKRKNQFYPIIKNLESNFIKKEKNAIKYYECEKEKSMNKICFMK